LAVLVIFRQTQETGPVQPAVPAESIEAADEVSPRPVLPMAYAVIIVFFCSFAGMTLELSSTRLLAQLVGVSIFTWTGVIGVMLAGTALGNWIGGIIADYANTRWETRTLRLASLMILAGVTAVLSLVIFTIITRTHNPFASFGLIGQIIALTFSMFFLPMFFLGTISPQVIRLVVPDVSVAGRVAGRIYAWSTAGAIAGTFTTGYFLISHVGVYYTVLICAVFPIAAVTLIQGAFKNSLLLYGASAALGIVVGGFILRYDMQSGITLETNYYTIKVQKQQRPAIGKIGEDWEAFGAIAGPVAVVEEHLYAQLVLDFLVHSIVDLSDPEYLYYKHEQIQVEMVRHFRDRHPEEQRILVVGGGGYTFPRCVRSRIPTTQVDVVEIDPGVTQVAYSELNLDPKLNIQSFHMDGRQFVAEKARHGHYHLVTLDAVNDFSVPAHLMTKEFNEEVKKTLTDDGIYLVTVIDFVHEGKLWKAAARTLSQSFAHVEMVFPAGQFTEDDPTQMGRSVIVLYASNQPFSQAKLNQAVQKQTNQPSKTYLVPRPILETMLNRGKKIILTDQYCPVDNLMAEVFMNRNE
jgi:spermidine synthase/MFS family permease